MLLKSTLFQAPAGADAAAKEKAAIKGRLELPISILREQALHGDQFAVKALEIKLKDMT